MVYTVLYKAHKNRRQQVYAKDCSHTMGALKGFAPLSISNSPLFTFLVLWPTRWLDTLVRVELNKNRATAISA